MSETRLFKYRPNTYHHVTFSTKHRKKVLDNQLRERVHYWFDTLAQEYAFQLGARNSWIDHCHMLIFVKIGQDLSYVVNILKGVTARRIFEEFAVLPMQMREEHLWGRGFHAEEVAVDGLDAVRNYIQQQEDIHLRRLDREPLARLERWRDLLD